LFTSRFTGPCETCFITTLAKDLLLLYLLYFPLAIAVAALRSNLMLGGLCRQSLVFSSLVVPELRKSTDAKN
jgi:hypothetical protein